ncbi:MAG: hypothetical protein WC710_15145 [Gallionella sp.]|jgi:hypothetical protein
MNEVNLDSAEPFFGLTAKIDPHVIQCFDKAQTEIMRIQSDGRIFWRGREVETDDQFRSAMLELKAALMPNANYTSS